MPRTTPSRWARAGASAGSPGITLPWRPPGEVNTTTLPREEPDGAGAPMLRALGRYRIEEQIGSGGMGVVYRARDTQLKRTVAIKVIGDAAPDPGTRAAILREARAASALNHPNVCTIHEVGELEGGPYVVMEHVEGRTL